MPLVLIDNFSYDGVIKRFNKHVYNMFSFYPHHVFPGRSARDAEVQL